MNGPRTGGGVRRCLDTTVPRDGLDGPPHLAAAALTVTGVVTPVTAQSTAPAGGIAPATLELWLGGILTTATPGTPYETWVNHIIDRFKAANPGSDVKVDPAAVQQRPARGAGPGGLLLAQGARTR